MPDYAVPSSVDPWQLSILCSAKFGRVPDAINMANLTVLFDPALTMEQETLFTSICEVASAVDNFKVLPQWATWTAQEAADYITSNVLNGMEQAAVNSYIDAQITNITTADVSQINARLQATREMFKTVGAAVLTMRTILIGLAKAVVYLRNMTVR